jgi:hypothetical protein
MTRRSRSGPGIRKDRHPQSELDRIFSSSNDPVSVLTAVVDVAVTEKGVNL